MWSQLMRLPVFSLGVRDPQSGPCVFTLGFSALFSYLSYLPMLVNFFENEVFRGWMTRFPSRGPGTVVVDTVVTDLCPL